MKNLMLATIATLTVLNTGHACQIVGDGSAYALAVRLQFNHDAVPGSVVVTNGLTKTTARERMRAAFTDAFTRDGQCIADFTIASFFADVTFTKHNGDVCSARAIMRDAESLKLKRLNCQSPAQN